MSQCPETGTRCPLSFAAGHMEPIHHAIEPLTEAKSYRRYDRLTEPDSTAPIEHDFSTCLAIFFFAFSLRMSALSSSTAGRGLHMRPLSRLRICMTFRARHASRPIEELKSHGMSPIDDDVRHFDEELR